MIECAILIFEAYFLGCQALFTFDNASNHTAFSPNVFIAKYMNLSLEEKQPKIYSTYFSDRIQQDMVFLLDYYIFKLYE